MPRKIGVLAWLNVVLVGALVLGVVFGLHLFPRLKAGQKAVDGLTPAFAPDRAQGDRTGITFTSDVVNLLDPVTTAQGTGAAEVPKLVAYVAAKTGLSPATVVATLQAQFPHTLALLQAIPLSSVTTELPGFLTFVATELKVTPQQLATTLQTSFPHLYQAVANLPTVTNGWDNIPGLNGLTRFDGTAVKTGPQLRDYFSSDVIPVVEKHVTNFHRVGTYFPKVKYIAPMLTAIGGIAVLYGLIMMLRAASTSRVRNKEGTAEWLVVLLLGIVVLGIIFGTQVFPRLDGGSHLLRDARPGFTPARVAGDRGGINFVSHVVDLGDPIMNSQGKAADDIASLLNTLSSKTGLSHPELLAAITAKFPHTAALLQAVPLSAVSAEIPGVLQLVHIVLNQSNADTLKTLQSAVPGLSQAIINLPLVVNGWDNYPGGRQLTRFNGTPVVTAPQLRDYFSQDVIGAVETAAPDFRKLDISPDLSLFPGLLTIVGLLVVIYGIIMLIVVNMPDPEAELTARRLHGPGGRRAAGAVGTG